MMRIRFFPVLLTIALAGCSVSSLPDYKTDGVCVSFSKSEDYGIQMEIKATPDNDETYYCYSVLSRDAFDRLHSSDDAVMSYVMDSLRRDYEEWRQLIIGEDAAYVASLASYAFHLGTSTRYFSNLRPETEYAVFGFCYNPDRDVHIGPLSYRYLSTSPLSEEVSPMTLDFMVDMTGYGGQGLSFFSARPSVDGHPTGEPYLWGIVSEEELQPYGTDLMEYIKSVFEELSFNDYVDLALFRDINRLSLDEPVNLGETYIIFGLPYRPTWEHSLFTLTFVAENGLLIPYTHDPRP